MSDHYVSVIADRIIGVSNLAVGCEFDGEEVWIPFSLIEGDLSKDDFDTEMKEVEIGVQEWFAKKENLPY